MREDLRGRDSRLRALERRGYRASPRTGLAFAAVITGIAAVGVVSVLALTRSTPPSALRTGSTAGPPPGCAHPGEVYVDGGGRIFLCITAGSPGTWRRLATSAPGLTDASGAIDLFPSPIRVYDSRATQGKIGRGQTRNIPVRGVKVGAPAVPQNAVAVIGTITAAAPEGQGDLRVFPSGQPRPDSSTLNFFVNQSVAGTLFTRIGDNGGISVYSEGANTHVVIDISGYIY
jgi:hypothetical protein